MRLSMHVLAALSMLILCTCSTRLLGATPEYAVIKTFKIGGPGGWDYITVDSQAHRLYVPRSTHTMVIDAGTGKTIADIPGQKRAHGVAVVPQVGRGFISDGGERNGGAEGAVIIFDLKTNKVLGSIPSPVDTDGIIYDPGSNQVFTVSGDKQVLVPIKPDVDPKNGKEEPAIDLGGGPESLTADGHGRVFVDVTDKNEVAVIDSKADKLIAHWPVAPGGDPVGLGIDPEHHRLFVGCRRPQKMIVMSSEDGKVLADLPIGAGVDATKSDNGLGFASCRDGTLAIAGEASPGKFEIQTVKTPTGARTLDVDPGTHLIYLPTAEFEQGQTGRRPAPKPDSFMIVVVGPKAQG